MLIINSFSSEHYKNMVASLLFLLAASSHSHSVLLICSFQNKKKGQTTRVFREKQQTTLTLVTPGNPQKKTSNNTQRSRAQHKCSQHTVNRRYNFIIVDRMFLRKVTKARKKGARERQRGEEGECVVFGFCFTYGSRRSHHSCVRTISAENRKKVVSYWHKRNKHNLEISLSFKIHWWLHCNHDSGCNVRFYVYIHNERPASRFYSTNRGAADDHRRVFWDVGFIVCVFCETPHRTEIQWVYKIFMKYRKIPVFTAYAIPGLQLRLNSCDS